MGSTLNHTHTTEYKKIKKALVAAFSALLFVKVLDREEDKSISTF